MMPVKSLRCLCHLEVLIRFRFGKFCTLIVFTVLVFAYRIYLGISLDINISLNIITFTFVVQEERT